MGLHCAIELRARARHCRVAKIEHLVHQAEQLAAIALDERFAFSIPFHLFSHPGNDRKGRAKFVGQGWRSFDPIRLFLQYRRGHQLVYSFLIPRTFLPVFWAHGYPGNSSRAVTAVQ